MIADYDELKVAVADFLNRDDLTSVVPTFIRLAEARVDRDLRHWRQELFAALTLDDQRVALPFSYLQTISLSLTDAPLGALEPVSVAQMARARGDREDLPGAPTSYAITGGQIELYPTPDKAYGASMLYHSRVPALSASNTSNWLLAESPDTYLYGALLHSAPYIKDDSRVAIWESLYKMGVDSLNRTSEDAKYGGTGIRMKPRRGAP